MGSNKGLVLAHSLILISLLAFTGTLLFRSSYSVVRIPNHGVVLYRNYLKDKSKILVDYLNSSSAEVSQKCANNVPSSISLCVNSSPTSLRELPPIFKFKNSSINILIDFEKLFLTKTNCSNFNPIRNRSITGQQLSEYSLNLSKTCRELSGVSFMGNLSLYNLVQTENIKIIAALGYVEIRDLLKLQAPLIIVAGGDIIINHIDSNLVLPLTLISTKGEIKILSSSPNIRIRGYGRDIIAQNTMFSSENNLFPEEVKFNILSLYRSTK